MTEVQQAARVLIMQLLVAFLEMLEDFNEAGQYSWGSAVLAYLYRSLSRAADFQQCTASECLTLLQLWAWERIPLFRPEGVLNYAMLGDLPYGARWACPHKWDKATKLVVKTFRDQLDRMRFRNFDFTPYPLGELPGYCIEASDIWTSVVPLIYFYVVEMHYPNRFYNQFGAMQDGTCFSSSIQQKISGFRLSGSHIDWSKHHAPFV